MSMSLTNQNEQNSNLLPNDFNNLEKENNNINKKNFFDEIKKDERKKYENISDLSKSSSFNKNLIIAENNEENDIALNKNEKLKEINYGINQNISNQNNQNNENSDIKISVISPDFKPKTSPISIGKTSNSPKTINNNNLINNDNNSEKNKIIYDFGYTKEERLVPLKLSLIKTSNFEDKKNSELESQKLLKIDNNITFNNNQNDNIRIEENEIQENNNYEEESKNELKLLIIPQSEKEIAYYKEKDLFDEEIKDYKFNITQNQMNILDNYTHKKYIHFKDYSKRKKFKIFHPYCEYNYQEKKTLEQRKQNLNNIFRKQHMIISKINNLKLKKFKIKNLYSSDNILKNSKNNNFIGYKYSNFTKNYPNIYCKIEFNRVKHQKKFRSISSSNYHDEINWEKRQQMMESKKEYSIGVLLNERKLSEQRKKAKLIKKIRLNNQQNEIFYEKKDNENNEENEYDEENKEDFDNNKLPLIEEKNKVKPESEKSNYEIKKIYTNSYNPFKKYKLKKKDEEKIFNTIVKHNPKLEQLLYSHDIYKIKFDSIKSTIK